MSLRLRIHLNTILTLIFILAMVGLIAVQYANQRKILQKETIIQDLTREMVTLSFLTTDFMTSLNEGSQTAWLSQFHTIQTLSQQKDEIASALSPYFENIENQFDQLTELTGATDGTENNPDHQLVLRQISLSLYPALQEVVNELGIMQDEIQTELLRIQRNTLLGTITFFVLLSVILTIITHGYIRFILRPLNQLMQGVTQLEGGNFDHQMPIDSGRGSIQSSNELGELAVAFNRMAGQLQLTLADLRQELAANLAITERLRESENQFHTIFNIASLGIAQVNPQTGKIDTINEGYQSITGYTVEELLTMHFQEITHPDDHEADWEGFKHAMHEKDTYVTEKRYVRKDGATIWVRLNVAFIRNDAGEAISTVAICENISDRKQAEENLRRSETMLRAIQKLAHVGGWEWDITAQKMYWSDETYRIHGFSEKEIESGSPELIQQSVSCYEPGDRNVIMAAFEKCVADGTPYSLEFPCTTVTGETKWIVTMGTPVWSENNVVVAVRGNVIDITARKQVEDALRESEEKMRSIFRVAPTGIGLVKERVLQEVNPRLCQMTGYTKEELIGQNARILYPTQEDYEFVGFEKYRQIARTGTGEVETRWLTKDGTIIDILLASTPLDADDLSKGVTFTALDITERLEADAALRASEEQSRLLFHTVPEMILILNNKLEILQANTAASDFTGYSLDELLTMHSTELAPTAPPIFDEQGSLVESLLGAKLHTEITTRSGEIRLMEVGGVPIEFHGQPAFLIVAYDETERVQAERRILESEELLRTVIETIPQPLFIYDEEGRYIMGNHALAELLQTDINSILGKTNFDLAQDDIMSMEEARNYHENAMIPLLTRQSYFKQIETYKDPDGMKHNFQVYSMALQLPDRKKRVVIVTNEITEIMQARTRLEAMNEILEQRVNERTRDLEQARQQIDTILQHSPDGFILLDENYNIQVMNPAFIRLLGIDPQKYLNHHLTEIVSPQNNDLFEQSIVKAIENRQPVSIEHTATRVDLSTFDCLTSFSPIYDGDTLNGFVVGVHDISPQKEVQRMKDAFVSNVSHELRTPITNFICNLDLIRMNPAKQDIYLSRLDMEVVQLKNIIEDLLRLSRLDQGGVQMARTPIDLNVLCKDFSSLRAPLADQKNLSLTFLPSGDLPRIFGDYGLISQVLSILLTNAINYTPNGGKIFIRTHPQDEEHGERIGFSVHDNGPGILPEDHERIFERFYRGEAGLQSGVPGTGLGLPIAQEIIRRHDGLLELQSIGIAGEGTTFTVWLPIDQPPAD